MIRIAYVINSVEGGGAALPVPSIADVLREGRCGKSAHLRADASRRARAVASMEGGRARRVGA